MADVKDWLSLGMEVAGGVGGLAAAYLAVVVRNIITTCNSNIQASRELIMKETRELVDRARDAAKAGLDLTNTKVQTAEIELASHIVQDQERFNANSEKVAALHDEMKEIKKSIQDSTRDLANLINRNYNERKRE